MGNADNGWRIAGLCFTRPPAEVTAQFLEGTKDLRAEESCAPEDADSSRASTPSAVFARDMYSYGALAADVLGRVAEPDAATRRFLADVVEGKLLSDEPTSRPTAAAVLRDVYVVFLPLPCEERCYRPL